MEREEERRGEWIARNVVSGQKLRRTKFSSDKFSVNELNFSKICTMNFSRQGSIMNGTNFLDMIYIA